MSQRKGSGFTLHGKPFDPAERGPMPSEVRLVETLNALPDGVLLDTEEICARARFGRMTVFTNVRTGHLEPYRLKLNSRKVYFGNRKTVALARKELQRREEN